MGPKRHLLATAQQLCDALREPLREQLREALRGKRNLVELELKEGCPQVRVDDIDTYEPLLTALVKKRFHKHRNVIPLAKAFWLLDSSHEFGLSRCKTEKGRRRWAAECAESSRMLVTYVKRQNWRSASSKSRSAALERLKKLMRAIDEDASHAESDDELPAYQGQASSGSGDNDSDDDVVEVPRGTPEASGLSCANVQYLEIRKTVPLPSAKVSFIGQAENDRLSHPRAFEVTNAYATCICRLEGPRLRRLARAARL